MPGYTTILVALDLSPDSSVVIEAARRLTDNEHHLHLVYVAEHPVTALGSSTGKNHRHGELQVRQELYPKVHEYTHDLAVPPDHIHILFGDPPTEIHYLAEKLGADVIVAGSHGEKGLKRLLGTTATDILHGASCDVLTVRIHETKEGG
ncbi:universal stress protein [Marinimicrobium agarilyticum]|uniref:universal stress protein n=1 Tax=Marinimicrobium agarilyticum TaxID=306546 RepID=UPI00040985AE|nr:universal stress protein [Marinimicrobium agarilyticum]